MKGEVLMKQIVKIASALMVLSLLGLSLLGLLMAGRASHPAAEKRGRKGVRWMPHRALKKKRKYL
jgi:hypothetical protein